MKEYTLAFFFKDGKIILSKKMRKIGAGKWNGYGGRIEEQQDKITNLLDEVKDECGVILDKEKCKELGVAYFYFDDKSFNDLKVYVFRIDEFDGYPKETEEMGEPKEFDLDKIPYEEMMLGDDEFLHFVLENKKFEGEIHFLENGEKMVSAKFKEIGSELKNEFKLH